MKLKLDENWTTSNGNAALFDTEVKRYISVLPNENQLRLQEKPFYIFFHFGMNTATDREWGSGKEKASDFNIEKIKPEQWIKAVKASGATGVILTCKHHDGFCLWDTKYTKFNVMNSKIHQDIVKAVADECYVNDLDFGVYLSPWDMHEETYGTPEYNDYFVNQLTELLTNYGKIFEVWFDGAKGAEAKEFHYDWERYYKVIHELQPQANIAICGRDVRWVGNEGGKSRKSEYSVVPSVLSRCKDVEDNSQKSEQNASSLKRLEQTDEDLGSRKVLEKNEYLSWYPAEVDVSIRKGWFFHNKENNTVKSVNRLMKIYLESVGNNCTLLLNVPPSNKGVIHYKDVRRLKEFGKRIKAITQNPIIVSDHLDFKESDGYLEYRFDSVKKLKYCVLQEDITRSQRVEQFDLFILKPNGKYKRVYKGTVIGANKIIKINKNAVGAIFIVRQSRSNPCLKHIGFYE